MDANRNGADNFQNAVNRIAGLTEPKPTEPEPIVETEDKAETSKDDTETARSLKRGIRCFVRTSTSCREKDGSWFSSAKRSVQGGPWRRQGSSISTSMVSRCC